MPKIVLHSLDVKSARYLDNAENEIFLVLEDGSTMVIRKDQDPTGFTALVEQKEVEIVSYQKQRDMAAAREELAKEEEAARRKAAEEASAKSLAEAKAEVAQQQASDKAKEMGVKVEEKPQPAASPPISTDADKPAATPAPVVPLPSSTAGGTSSSSPVSSESKEGDKSSAPAGSSTP